MTKIPSSIKEIASELNTLTGVNNNTVSEIVSTSKLSEKELSDYATFHHPNHESYGRKLIVDNGNFKILLMSWKPGDFTAIHNHGYTEWGCVYFFGEVNHRLYKLVNNELKLVQKDIFRKGQIGMVCGDLIHIMGNSGTEEFTTLHIYGSNSLKSNVSKDAQIFLPELNKIVTTKGEAYLNINRTLILSEKPMNNICKETLIDYFHLIKPFYERNNNLDMIKKTDLFLNNLN